MDLPRLNGYIGGLSRIVMPMNPLSLCLLSLLLLPLSLSADEAQRARLQAQVEQQQAALAQLQQQFLELPDEAELDQLLQRLYQRLQQQMAEDLPFQEVQRKAEMAQLQGQLSDLSQPYAERVRLLFRQMRREVERGQTLEAWDGELKQQEGEPARLVTYVRYGRLALIYQSFDGQQAGYWQPSQRRWLPLPQTLLGEVRRAIQIAHKRLPPDLLVVPVSTRAEIPEAGQ